MKMPTYLPPLLQELRDLSAEVKTRFGHLNAAQLNWKPAPKSWSIAQCFDHLMTSDRLYFPLFEEIAAGKKRMRFMERFGFLARFFGKMLLRDAHAVVKKPMKAPGAFVPAASALPGDIVETYAAHLLLLAEKMALTEKADPSMIVTSPAASIVVYSLEVTHRLLPGHNRRHVNQAIRVLENPNFPQQ